MSQAVIEARGIHVTFGEAEAACRALRDVSVDIMPGEVLVIMGPSGSGKTTLTQVIGCLLRPTAGCVRVLGEATEGLSARALDRLRLNHYGFVFQTYNLFPTLTAWENVALALDLVGIRRQAAEDRARALLDEVGLGDKADSYPGALSGGQRQRIAVARALARDPTILLADEPTAALDTASGQSVIALFGRLAKSRGRAIVIVTHDPRVARHADRVLTLEDGRVANLDTRH